MCIHTYVFIHAPVSVIIKKLWTKKYKKHSQVFCAATPFFSEVIRSRIFLPYSSIFETRNEINLEQQQLIYLQENQSRNMNIRKRVVIKIILCR